MHTCTPNNVKMAESGFVLTLRTYRLSIWNPGKNVIKEMKERKRCMSVCGIDKKNMGTGKNTLIFQGTKTKSIHWLSRIQMQTFHSLPQGNIDRVDQWGHQQHLTANNKNKNIFTSFPIVFVLPTKPSHCFLFCKYVWQYRLYIIMQL